LISRHDSWRRAARNRIGADDCSIPWKAFGKIVLGEVHIKDNHRCVVTVRLAGGSDARGQVSN
jgi:hypothetical protein